MDKEDSVFHLSLERSDALGHLLGCVDAILVFDRAGLSYLEALKRLRELRDIYNAKSKAYLDARLEPVE